ncbi:MAG TPA: hypothetical protein VLG11_05360 [Candidatus Saccharimonadales bacterium]|nr:hypothetical protein [Candidatus Saccharimonadales bacterium]
MRKFQALTLLGKVFVVLTIAILGTLIALYVFQLKDALSMDPHSFNCLHDSMMSQICHDPYGSSVSWAVILLIVLGWPVLAVWAVLGVVLLVRRKRSSKRPNTPAASGIS